MNTWMKSLLAAAIGGAATSLSSMVIDPEHFNTADIRKLAIVASVGAALGVISYLKQSPLAKE